VSIHLWVPVNLANIVVVITVPDAETHFQIDEFNDLYAKTKPTVYMKMSDIFSIHQMVVLAKMTR
jgi:hypothetical protein